MPYWMSRIVKQLESQKVWGREQQVARQNEFKRRVDDVSNLQRLEAPGLVSALKRAQCQL